jgi:hypothetical protein
VTSNINYSAINENFPVAGQDNDTQVFRDNFDTIKTNFQTAQTEITALQNATQGLALDAYDEAELGVAGSDYNGGIIYNAVIQNSVERKFDGGALAVTVNVDYENGNYQIFRIGANVNIEFQNFPNDNSTPDQLGKVTLELYSDGTARTVTFSTSGGTVIKKNSNVAWSGNSITLTSAESSGGSGNPVIVEVWQHKTDRIFINYIGQFSS